MKWKTSAADWMKAVLSREIAGEPTWIDNTSGEGLPGSWLVRCSLPGLSPLRSFGQKGNRSSDRGGRPAARCWSGSGMSWSGTLSFLTRGNFRRVNMVEVFSGRTLLNKDGDLVDPELALRNKVVGIYFSAGWCPPCRDFTPILCDFYTELVEEGEPPAQFEIVFISSDKTLDDMVEYYHDMHGDWLALPWTDEYKQWVLGKLSFFSLDFSKRNPNVGLLLILFFLPILVREIRM